MKRCDEIWKENSGSPEVNTFWKQKRGTAIGEEFEMATMTAEKIYNRQSAMAMERIFLPKPMVGISSSTMPRHCTAARENIYVLKRCIQPHLQPPSQSTPLPPDTS